MIVEDDFIQRQIKQIAQAIVRAMGVTADARAVDAALEALDRGYDDCLGMPRAIVDHIAEPSLALTLGGDRLVAYAWLLERQAELRERRGELAESARLRVRAQRVAALINDAA